MTSWRCFAVVVLAATISAAASEAAEKNFSLTIGAKTGDVSTVQSGRNELTLYETDQFSFSHPAAVSVEVTTIEGALTQYTAATKGTAIIIQHHVEVGDEDLIAVRDIFVNNVLRNPIASGARIARSNISRKLHDETEIKGVRAMVANEKADITVAAYTMRLGKGALMFVTIFGKSSDPDEGVIIDQFWETLRVKG